MWRFTTFAFKTSSLQNSFSFGLIKRLNIIYLHGITGNIKFIQQKHTNFHIDQQKHYTKIGKYLSCWHHGYVYWIFDIKNKMHLQLQFPVKKVVFKVDGSYKMAERCSFEVYWFLKTIKTFSTLKRRMLWLISVVSLCYPSNFFYFDWVVIFNEITSREDQWNVEKM